jgi:hypothetical protein
MAFGTSILGITDACVAPRKEAEGVLRLDEMVRRLVLIAGRWR